MSDNSTFQRLARCFPAEAMTVFAWDKNDQPAALRVIAQTAGERALALVLLRDQPASFVLWRGMRYSPDGRVQPLDPTRPASAAELSLSFNVETVGADQPGSLPRVYLFTRTEQEWETARAALRHLVRYKLLSPRSYLEGSHTGQVQGLSAEDLDGSPHDVRLVRLFREAAYCAQNELHEQGKLGEDDYDVEQGYWTRGVYQQDEDEDEDEERDEEWEEDDLDEAWREEQHEDAGVLPAEVVLPCSHPPSVTAQMIRAMHCLQRGWHTVLGRFKRK